MASSLLRTTFVPSFYSHRDALSFPSSLGLSTTSTAPPPGELKVPLSFSLSLFVI